MNVLFLTLMKIRSAEEHGIYPDLIREFANHGHQVYVVTPHEKSDATTYTACLDEGNTHIIQARIDDYFNQGVVKKGIATLTLSRKYVQAIDANCSGIMFDLVLYSTPPITFNDVIRKYKNRDNAKTYLLLKDIWPQGPVDMGALTTTGIKGLIYNYFRNVEKKMYALSDHIGCMSQENVDYVIEHNPETKREKVEICPNSIDVIDKSVDEETRKRIREKYEIPLGKKVFVYGGNLGIPQGIPFLIECLKACADLDDAYFLIVGAGTEYPLLEQYEKTTHQTNFRLMQSLPKEDYDNMVSACDVGMIFLDHRFTIPNFPSRLLVYMQAKLPVLACTDTATDLGDVIADGNFGWWCESNDSDSFVQIIKRILIENTFQMGMNAFNYLEKNYNVELAYETIMKRLK